MNKQAFNTNVISLVLLLLGILTFPLRGQVSKSARKSFEETKLKAKAGMAVAQHNIGVMYANRLGIAQIAA